MTRTAGKLGRRAPKRARALKLANYLTGVLPTVPANADYLAALGGGWEMLGNDAAGDCVAVTWANTRRLVSTALGTANYPTQAQVWKIYQTQNPKFNPNGGASTGPGSQYDNGMDIQTLLEWLTQTAGPDGVKALGFAAVDYANPAEVKAAIALFGSVWTGINVQSQNQTQFSEGQPWDWSYDGQVEGGHSIITGGYGTPGSGALGGDERFITWAQETSFTDNFWKDGVDECWAVIWPEHLGSKEFLAGVDMTALAADYQEITGKPFPASVNPAPSPFPVPPAPVSPTGNIFAEVVEKLEALLTWLKSVL
jgi:hypothetical protein